jgi:hypothetical protein
MKNRYGIECSEDRHPEFTAPDDHSPKERALLNIATQLERLVAVAAELVTEVKRLRLGVKGGNHDH